MQRIETTGKTIEAALDAALAQLQVAPERVEVEVLEEPSRAALGLVQKDARIRVTVLKESALEAERLLSQLLEKMGIAAELEHRLDTPDEGPAIIDIKGADMGVLIGWRGETLRAMQLLINTMVRQALPEADAVVLDVERYRARREDSLQQLALRLADRAKRNGERIGLEPMLAYERRAVHSALAGDPDVSTESEGEEPGRRVVITPSNARRQEIVDFGRERGGYGRERAGYGRGRSSASRGRPARGGGGGGGWG